MYRALIDGRDVSPLASLTFQTPAPGPFEFLAFGDSGDGGHPQEELARRMMREPAALAIHTGDIAYQEGTFRQFEDFYLRTYWPMMSRIPFFPAPGNHDYVFHDGAAFVALHDLPASGVVAKDRGRYYSFDWGNVDFVALDSNTPFVEALAGRGEMLRWLERDLAATRQEFRVVYFHHTAFPTANYRGDSRCLNVAAALTEILERHGVHLVLMGHEHLYQRTEPRRGAFRGGGIGTIYVTTGGAGSTVYPPGDEPYLVKGAGAYHYLRFRVDERAMQAQVVGLGGEILDEFSISSAPRIELEGVRDAARGRRMLAPGGLASLHGSDLARGDTPAGAFPLPVNLDGVSIRVSGRPAPLLFASRNQVNFQVPVAAGVGEHEVILSTAAGESLTRATVRLVAPAAFVVAHAANGALVTPVAPAQPDEWVSVYLTGLGATARPVADGDPAPLGQLISVTQSVRVDLAGLECQVGFAGLVPGFAGLNQINVRIPVQAEEGSRLLRVTAAGGSSDTIPIVIKR